MSQISDNNRRIVKNACFSTFMIKADIRSRFPEPYASMYCQQFDNFKNVADFLEFAAKLMRRQ